MTTFLSQYRFAILVFGMLMISLKLSTSASAATNVELYESTVIVPANVSQQAQDEATQDGFTQMMVKVTGQTAIAQSRVVQDESSRAGQYLRSFRFEPSDVTFRNALGEPVPTKTLVLSFDSNSVDQFLRNNRLPIWGERRPEVLVWLADRTGSQERVMADGQSTTNYKSVIELAAERGLPVSLPIGDLTDTLALPFNSLFGLFSNDILQASDRYSPDAILAGKLENTGQGIRADWVFFLNDDRLSLTVNAPNAREAISAGIDLATQRLASQYAVVDDPMLSSRTQIEVINIDQALTFSAVERYLRSINRVTDVVLMQLTQARATFELELAGNENQLFEVLALDGWLTIAPSQDTAFNLSGPRQYLWSVNDETEGVQ